MDAGLAGRRALVLGSICGLGISNARRASVVAWGETLAGDVAAAGVTVTCRPVARSRQPPAA